MKKTFVWAGRVTKEILRDPLSAVFGIGFPIVLLLLLSAIQSRVPVKMFTPEELTPGVAVFGLSFLSLFSAQLIAKDRAGFLLGRMLTTPTRAVEFILGYTLPLLPMALFQGGICYAVAIVLGLPVTPRLLLGLFVLLPISALYIGIGLLCGSVMSEKTATTMCGALLTNLSAWLSGTWFSTELVGEWFDRLAHLLPFSHAVDLGRAVVRGAWSDVPVHLAVVCSYAALVLIAAVLAFRKKMKS